MSHFLPEVNAKLTYEQRKAALELTDLLVIGDDMDGAGHAIIALRAANERLREALRSAIGWINYAVDCDAWYFSHDQAPEFEKEIEVLRAVLAEGKGENS